MKLIIGSNIFKVKLRSNPISIMNGMMNKTFDDSFNGMFFMMPEKTNQKFWMYNCIIPLDIIFIDGKMISKIYHSCPMCNDKENCQSYSGFGDKVLEVFGGTCRELGIEEGDSISLSLI